MNGLYENLIDRREKLSLVGLGYVGIPIAVSFAKKIDVIGFDLNEKKIELYKNGINPTQEVGDEARVGVGVRADAVRAGRDPAVVVRADRCDGVVGCAVDLATVRRGDGHDGITDPCSLFVLKR